MHFILTFFFEGKKKNPGSISVIRSSVISLLEKIKQRNYSISVAGLLNWSGLVGVSKSKISFEVMNYFYADNAFLDGLHC